VHGVVGGVLLLLVVALLVQLSARAWEQVPAQRRPARVLVVAVIVALAVLKLAGRL
jgi:hypothetical protein